MGSKKAIQMTGSIEEIVPSELYDSCFQIRTGLNLLETMLERDFPNVNEATAIAHLDLQEAMHYYFNVLSKEVVERSIVNSRVVSSNECSFSQLVPNLIRYLGRFGEAGFSSLAAYGETVNKIGIFLKKEEIDRFLGFLEEMPDSLIYSGYVPTNLSELEFFEKPVEHLSTAPKIKGANLVFVRLFAERKEDRFERADAYSKKGIEFP